MCSHVFPALYLNLGVEMMYILDQRLRVQSDSVEDREKSDKVVKQIMMGFLSKKTLDEVFKGHGTPTPGGLKMFFEKVAHCSIMRLNENSMDKLFDLMMMAYKFALQQITMPEQIMTVTVNHLRALLDLVPLDKDIGAAVEHAYTMAFTFFRPLGPMGWYMLRNSLLSFFQDTRVKVSMFINDSRQLANGRFVLFQQGQPVQMMLDAQEVGVTKYFTPAGQVTHTTDFPVPYKYTPYENLPDTLDAPKRSTDLGANMYRNSASLKIQGGGGAGKSDRKVKEGDEMALFESLMNSQVASDVDDSQIWGMSLFDDEQDEKTYQKETAENQNVTRIDASKKKKSLKTAMDDMKIDKARPPTASAEKKKKTKGASMLDLMDEAAARPATAKGKAKRSESTGTPQARPKTRDRASSAAPKRTGSAKKRP